MKIVLGVIGIFVFCALMGILFGEREPEPTQADKAAIEQSEPGEKLTFKEECEKNAAEYPAKMGAILYTKGDYNFTGMKYYFKGEVVRITTIENIGNPSVWLVKNEHGYVMPIQHDRFKAEVGDIVEVWGTLTGNGYANAEGIDNVVGQTGSMHAIQVTVNGEEQF